MVLLAFLEVGNADWVVVLAHFVCRPASSSLGAALDTPIFSVNSVILNFYREKILCFLNLGGNTV